MLGRTDAADLLAHLYASVLVADEIGRVLKVYGRPRSEEHLLAEPSLAGVRSQLEGALAHRQPVDLRIDWIDGQVSRARGVPITLSGGAPGYALAIEEPTLPFATVTRRLDTAEYEFIVANMRQGLWRVNRKGVIQHANPYLAQYLETTVEELEGAEVREFAPDWSAERHGRFEAEFRTKTGIQRRALVHSTELVSPRGRVLGTLDLITDITAEHALRTRLVEEVQRMTRLAHTDPLTGLANRMEFEQHLRAASEAGTPYAVVYADLDSFKEINDTLGHAMGDLVLIELAKRMRQGVRDNDIVARIGGDEFAILLPGATMGGASDVVARLHRLLNFSASPGDRPVSVRVSLGMAHSDDGEAVAVAADRAMYAQKRRRKDADDA